MVRYECIENQMNSVIQNLLHNSIKFTKHLPQSTVQIRINVEPFLSLKKLYDYAMKYYEARGSWLELHVEDNGPGIEPSILPSIFNLYYTKSPHGVTQSGTGMGLAISRLVVTMHGGIIFVNTRSDLTDFVILLPQHHADGIDPRLLVKGEFSL